MAETLSKRMTVDEFFEWQQRQDRNYELVDGVPVLTVKAMTGASEKYDARAIIDNIKSSTPHHIAIQIDEPLLSVIFFDANVTIRVMPSQNVSFDFACAVAYDIFRGERTLLLVDTEQPRASLWHSEGVQSVTREITDLSGWINLPVIGPWLTLGSLYNRQEFSRQT